MRALTTQEPAMYRYVSATLASSVVAYTLTLTGWEQLLRVGSSAVFFLTCLIGCIAAGRKLYKDWNK